MHCRTPPEPRPDRGARLLVALALACALAPASARGADPAPAGNTTRTPGSNGTGRITGTIVLGSKLTARQMRFHLYPDAVAAAARRPVPGLGDEMKNVVVYLESAPESAAAAASRPGPPPAMRQSDLAFVPHVLPIVRGTEVEFPNGDPIFHNVFSLSRAATFDLGRYPKGSSKTVRFDTPGVVKVFCHIHSDMSAVVLVLDNPFFASPGVDGHFALDDLPPGDYRVTAWHERAHPTTRRVHVEAGGDAVVDFDIPLTDAAEGK
jgi:plastocyanin